LAQPFAIGSGSSAATTDAGARAVVSLVQIRNKSRFKRPEDRGVVVRLLQDIPQFGRKDAIFRTERGRMRNDWFPNNKAEYMTTSRFQQLGLTRQDVGERDPMFGTSDFASETATQDTLANEIPMPFTVPPAPQATESTIADSAAAEPEVEAKPVTGKPEEALALLEKLVPSVLTFYRKTVPKTAAVKPAKPAAPTPEVSPLIASFAEEAPPKSEEQLAQESTSAANDGLQAIFGSVSLRDVMAEIRKALDSSTEAANVNAELIQVRWVKNNSSTVKKLGDFDISITVSGSGEDAKPVQRVVQVLPEN